MQSSVRYDLAGPIATITMDDAKVNAVGPRLIADLHAALDRAEADRAVVILAGRQGIFCAGFDLAILRAGGVPAVTLVRSGLELAARILGFPLPVVIACSGPAVAMGLFLVVAGDYRVGAAGDYPLVANEVAIGLAVPRGGVELLRQRLSPACFNRATTIAEAFSPHDAVAGGLLDRVVDAGDLGRVARETAERLATLDLAAHAATKARVRQDALTAIRSAIAADLAAAG